MLSMWPQLVAAALSCCLTAAASAGTLVEFPNLAGHTPAALRGYLARPDAGMAAILGEPSGDAAPYPAVVVLHGCSGATSHSMAIADRLGGWGYVALAVDSFATRGIDNHCGGMLIDQAFDAYAALDYLARLPLVDPARVAVLGQSMGGFSALYALDRGQAAQYFDRHFRAAISYYPNCGIPAASLTAPTLILIGEADDWTPAEACRDYLVHPSPYGIPIAVTIYPGAYHAFDVAELQDGASYRGHRLAYDEAAAKDAEKKSRAFLAEHLHGKPSR